MVIEHFLPLCQPDLAYLPNLEVNVYYMNFVGYEIFIEIYTALDTLNVPYLQNLNCDNQ